MLNPGTPIKPTKDTIPGPIFHYTGLLLTIDHFY
jgi:hypothetical protein